MYADKIFMILLVYPTEKPSGCHFWGQMLHFTIREQWTRGNHVTSHRKMFWFWVRVDGGNRSLGKLAKQNDYLPNMKHPTQIITIIIIKCGWLGRIISAPNRISHCINSQPITNQPNANEFHSNHAGNIITLILCLSLPPPTLPTTWHWGGRNEELCIPHSQTRWFKAWIWAPAPVRRPSLAILWGLWCWWSITCLIWGPFPTGRRGGGRPAPLYAISVFIVIFFFFSSQGFWVRGCHFNSMQR